MNNARGPAPDADARTATRCRARRTCRSRSCSLQARRHEDHAGERRRNGRTSASSTSTSVNGRQAAHGARDRLQRQSRARSRSTWPPSRQDACSPRKTRERQLERAQNVGTRRRAVTSSGGRSGPAGGTTTSTTTTAPSSDSVTAGAWRAERSSMSIRSKRRAVLRAPWAGRTARTPYYTHTYKREPRRYRVSRCSTRAMRRTRALSPNKSYLVDNASRIDMVPTRSCCAMRTGKEIMDLETMDVSRLKELGWKLPETFGVKAADGTTDMYGNMWKPFDFDPKKKYPIIAHVYPGPQTEGVTHTFSAYGCKQQLAQLGFIVIQVGHRGGSPQRSKAYQQLRVLQPARLRPGRQEGRHRAARGALHAASTSTGWASTAIPAAASCRPRPHVAEAVQRVLQGGRGVGRATTTTTFTTTTGPSGTTA